MNLKAVQRVSDGQFAKTDWLFTAVDGEAMVWRHSDEAIEFALLWDAGHVRVVDLDDGLRQIWPLIEPDA